MLDKFFSNKDKKLCLIKFGGVCFLNYVKFFIENKEKDNEKIYEKYKKAFVFIVHVKRNFKNYDENKIQKYGDNENKEMSKYNETIPLSSEFYQIFIDDLNQIEEYTIKDLLKLKGKELFKKYIDYRKLLENDIYDILSYMNYNLPYSYRGINRNNYIRKLINYIQDKENLQKKINDIIMNQMKKDENLINNVLKAKNLVREYDTDIISSIQRYLYTRFWVNFYYKAEKDQFFSSILSLYKEEKKQHNKNEIIIDEEENEEKNIKKGDKKKKMNI